MTNEIKEIRENISCPQFGDNHYGKWGALKLDQRKKIKELLDYVTNLQEEIKEWEMIFDTFSRRPYAHRYLEEKRKELNNDKIVGLDSESIYKDYYNLKQRIDKAVEYIDKWCLINENGKCLCYLPKEKCTKLLNILRGDE